MQRLFRRPLFILCCLASVCLHAAAPTITSFTPTSGVAGTMVTLTGTNFTGATAVRFNGTAASSFTVTSATKISAMAPTGVTTGKLSVTTSGGTATSSSSFAVSAPTITSFTPTSGVVGTTVTLTGTNFTGATAVKFNGMAASSFTVVGATSITAVAPTGVTTGKISVTTTGGTATSVSSFTVVAVPAIASFTPTSGAVGITVTLTGTNFTGTTAVRFNGTSATSYTVVSGTSITAVVPTNGTTGKISLTTAGGTATSSLSFTVVAAPTITSFTPTSGAVGTTVTLTGTNFTGVTAVKFNGTAASSYSVTNATTISAVAPTGVTTGKISVITPGGAATSSSNFIVAALPSISAFTASKTPITAGTSATLTGTFTGGTGAVDNGVGTVGSGIAVAITPGSTTNYTLTVTGTGGTATKQVTVTVVPLPIQPVITAPTKVTVNQAGYAASVPAQTGCTYAWTILGGTITAGATTNQMTFTPKAIGTMVTIREGFAASPLPSGKVLLTGGWTSAGVVASAETFDPATRAFTALANSMKTPRSGHTATLLQTGLVLLAGGRDGSALLASAELFNPSTGTFTLTAGQMVSTRSEAKAILLTTGEVLLVGGTTSYSYPDGSSGEGSTTSAEIFNPSDGTFRRTASLMNVNRQNTHTATGGTVTSNGFYTAPVTPGTYVVTVTCNAFNLSASATVTVAPVILSITPTLVALVPGQTQQFGWIVNGGGVTFAVLETGGGSITQTGLYTAPTLAGVYTAQVTSQLDPSKTARAKVTVNPIAISIDPAAVTLEVNQSLQFGASLNNGGWTWSATGGVIDDQGRYRAPLLPGSFTVTVQSVLDPSKTATSQVTVVAASALRLTPNEIIIGCGGTIPMTLVGIPDGANVTWSVTNGINGSPGGGTLGPGDIFTAGNTPGSYFITAMESSGGARANAQVQIISHRILPEDGLVGLGQQLQFTADVFDASPTVTWSIREGNGGTIEANGLYTAPLEQGQYHVVAQTSSGNLTTVPVTVGPPDGFTVTPEISILTAGTFEIRLRLKASNGKTTESLTSGDYTPGIATPAITFSQGQLKTDLGQDGPYTVEQMTVNQLVDGELLEVDRKNGLGVSGPYVIAEGDKPWISIGEVEQVIAEDSNSNGLIDTLKVQFTVNVICDGMYSIGGGLVSEDGSEVDSTQAEILLTRGPNVITIPFSGKRIYSCGKSGSYGIKGLTVTGPVMTSQDFPAAITGFSLDQFEH